MDQGLTLNVVLLALSSGLVGSVLALIGGYFVQKKLAAREIRRRTKQLCFSHLVEISHLLALLLATSEFFKSLIRIFFDKKADKITEELEKHGEDFELSHAICVAIEEGIQYLVKEKPDEIKKYSPLGKQFERMVKSASDFKLDNEVLLYLPHETNIEYSFYILHMMRLNNALTLWIEFLASGKAELLTAGEIYDQWGILQAIVESAKKLRQSLISKGELDSEEAKELFARQYHSIGDQLFSKVGAHFKLEKAKEYIKEKPWQKLLELKT